MGRAINKTVMIAELIKVGFLSPLVLSACLQMCLFLFSFSFPEKNRWSSSEYCNWFYWYNWCVGAARRGTSSVRIISCSPPIHHFFFFFNFKIHWFLFCLIIKLLIILMAVEPEQCSLETTRHVSIITITLSKKELDTSSTGYVSIKLYLKLFG